MKNQNGQTFKINHRRREQTRGSLTITLRETFPSRPAIPWQHTRAVSVLAPRDARRMAAAQLSITIPGFSDVTGHTEYIIKSSVGDQQFTVQHRFSNFVELHDALASKIAKLPATFPVAKNMFNGEAVKRERVEKLQEYLRNVVRLSGEKPPIALLKFLRIDASVFAPPSERSERGIATGDGPYPSSSEPLQRFQPFSGVNAAFVPERPEDVNEALREGLKAGDDALCKELIESKADPLYRDRQGARDPRAHTSSAPMPPPSCLTAHSLPAQATHRYIWPVCSIGPTWPNCC